MLKDIKVSNIYIVCGHTDMRKSISGLAAIIQEQFNLEIENLTEQLLKRNRMLFGKKAERFKYLNVDGQLA